MFIRIKTAFQNYHYFNFNMLEICVYYSPKLIFTKLQDFSIVKDFMFFEIG